MNKKRFEIDIYSLPTTIIDSETSELYSSMRSVVDLLNKQEDTIITLKRRLERINGGYGHLTHYKGLTANEWLIQSQEKELKKKNEQISEWIEQHSKDIVKIGEQNKLIQKLDEENEQLRQSINKGRRLSVKELINNANENELLKKKIKGLEKENKQLRKQINNIDYAIKKAVSDLMRTEEVYLADFDIVKRISEYEKEFNEWR